MEGCKDCYALERNFLVYVRTASAHAIFGVTVAQVFNLQGPVIPTRTSAIFHLGRPIGAVAIARALLLILWATIQYLAATAKAVTMSLQKPEQNGTVHLCRHASCTLFPFILCIAERAGNANIQVQSI